MTEYVSLKKELEIADVDYLVDMLKQSNYELWRDRTFIITTRQEQDSIDIEIAYIERLVEKLEYLKRRCKR